MKKYLMTLGIALASVLSVAASDINPYVGTANVPYV